MKFFLVLCCYTIGCYLVFYTIGYETSKLDTHLRVLKNHRISHSLRHTCSELIEYNPDMGQVQLGVKAFCYEYEQGNK
jgi:hypothetical protein